MPSSETAKTKSARNRHGWWVGALILLLLATGGVIILLTKKDTSAPAKDEYLLSLGGDQTPNNYYLKAVRTAEAQSKGLSGTDRLESNHGMIFVNNHASEQCFWMKNMRYSLDIIWVDSDKRVTHIEEQVTPESYPETYCANAQYVIELNAGTAKENNLNRGDLLTF